MDETKKRIVTELRHRNIQLWRPPYYYPDDSTTITTTNNKNGNVKKGINEAALHKLATTWSTHILLTTKKEDVYEALVYFQKKALDKLQTKQLSQKKKQQQQQQMGDTFVIQILGLHGTTTTMEKKNEELKGIHVPMESLEKLVADDCAAGDKSWAEHVVAKMEPLSSSSSSSSSSSTDGDVNKKNKINGPMVITLTLEQISHSLSISTFFTKLKEMLGIKQHCTVRMIYQGTNLLQSSSSDDGDGEKEESLYHLVASSSSSRGGGGGGIPTILCLLSPSSSPSTSNTTQQQKQQQTDQQIISTLQKAASHLTQTSNFDITNQHGTIVPMSPTDKLAFVMTLGLHKLGQKRLYEQQEQEEEKKGTDKAASALTFLLAADAEWTSFSSSSAAEEWKTKADNYGLLQLDIAWSYLQLASIQHLPDALHRLEKAELVLKKQVHANFVTLALVQAEMETGVVPPLAAVFVRLFLLQGVAYLHSHSSSSSSASSSVELKEKARERLDWSYLLCQKLRYTSSPTSILALQEVIWNLSKKDAIVALRTCNGNAHAAIQHIEDEKLKVEEEGRKRQIQKRIGLCENGMDYVNLDLVGVLGDMLGLDLGSGNNSGKRWNDVDNSMVGSAMSTTTTMTTITTTPGCRKNEKMMESLLRLSNNDVNQAVDLYQSSMQLNGGGDEILSRASKLDGDKNDHHHDDDDHGREQHSNRRKRSWDDAVENSDEGSKEEERNVKVDDMALATLESMGVEESMAKMALMKTKNDVDASLFWLTASNSDKDEKKGGKDGGGEDAVSTSGSSSSSSLSSSSSSYSTSLASKRGLDACGGSDAKPSPPHKSSKKNAGVKCMERMDKDNDVEDDNEKRKSSATNDDDDIEKDGILQKKQEEEKRQQLKLQKQKEEEEKRLQRKREEEEAFQLLQDALEHHGGGVGDHDTMGYYIGSDLEEEWSLLQKYRRHFL